MDKGNLIKSLFATATIGVVVSLSMTSCFKAEPLNAECDIEQAYIHSNTPSDLFSNPSDSLVNVQSDENTITFTLKAGVDISSLAVYFKVTEGATISPTSGTTQDFSNGPVAYTVMSQDKKWTRTYNVYIKSQMAINDVLNFDFEDAQLVNGKYYAWYENMLGNDGSSARTNIWATGNPGFSISNGSAKPDEYPTIIDPNSYEGQGVMLVTRRTSKLADMVKKPIAAGNLFIGSFDAQNALQDAMKATKFGRPFAFSSAPSELSGYYKYQPGSNCTDKNMQEVDMEDIATIYAVLYDNHDSQGNQVVLYGDNVQTSSQVVGLAVLPDIHCTTEWTHFNIPFEYHKSIDSDKLKSGGYSLTVVASSSSYGAKFLGAVGSTLWIDKMAITCNNHKD